MSGMKSSTKVEQEQAGKKSSPEDVIRIFQQLRDEQRVLLTKIGELEAERKEHRLVISTLEGVDEGRRCFRLVGGVLVERLVKEVLPALRKNEEQIGNVLETLKEQLNSKNKQLTEYKEQNGIRFVNESELRDLSSATSGGASSNRKADEQSSAPLKQTSPHPGGVLVENS